MIWKLPGNLKSTNKLVPVILSGGSGTRLWPLSRECFPKQYLNLSEDNKYSLLQNTYLRLIGLKSLERPLIICNEEQRFTVLEQMREINIIPKSIILEPFGRNTGPAIALAAIKASQKNEDPYLLILSSDHQIRNTTEFKEAIKKGLLLANKGNLITFGVPPSHPETGYGYIESDEELNENIKYSPIKRFIEKPSKELATKFLQNKCFTWNSGIFLFKASSIINEFKKFELETLNYCKESLKKSILDLNFTRIHKDSFSKCKDKPIDIAIMEKTKIGFVLPFNVGWDDIGSWKTIWENSKKDKNGNFLKGKTIVKETNNCYIRSENRLVVGIGLENIIIIDTNDAILVADRNSSQTLKEVVKELEKSNLKEGKFNQKMYRPWGNFTSIVNGATWQVKRIEINPKASLSLQMHQHRSEHWVVVDGTAKVEINEKKSILKENESTYIPLGAKHRLSNPGDIPLIIIEVQSGDYLGEDDIFRFEDNYGRSNH
tara:strand:- start:132 stop:1598 length:1467 start_codon:yes stop_codon:yes gene_type:complete